MQYAAGFERFRLTGRIQDNQVITENISQHFTQGFVLRCTKGVTERVPAPLTQ
jgi:hypothetical protein